MLEKPQKQMSKTAGPLLSASLETVAHCRNVASLSFFVIILEKRKIFIRTG